MANQKVIEQKKQQVSDLVEKMKKAKLVLIADYRGINVEDITNIRTKLRPLNTEYKVIKNNITRRALQELKYDELTSTLEGPIAVLLGYEDYLEPSKVIYDFMKDKDYYEIKGGIIDGKVVSAEEIITLAKLPSRETLIAQLAGALLGNITKLAVALDQVSKQKAEA